MRFLCCVVLLAAPVNIFAFCNLNNCHNISSSELGSVGFELGAIESFDLKTVNTVVLNGLVEENCSLSLKCTSNRENDATNFRMEFVKMQAKFLLTHTPHQDVKPLTLVNSTITDLTSSYDAVVTIGIQFRLEDTVFAYYYTDDYKKRESNYIKSQSKDEFLTHFVEPSKRLLEGKGSKLLAEEITRDLSARGCGDELMLSLCPCSEPVITELEWNNETSVLNCSAVSIEGNENMAITWTENGDFVQDNRTETSFLNGDLMKTSMLLNVTSTEELKDYTCTVTLGSGSDTLNVTRTRRIPALTKEEEFVVAGEEDAVKDKEDGSQAFLTIIILVIVGGLVVITLICIGILKLVRHYFRKKPKPFVIDALEITSDVSSEEQPIIPVVLPDSEPELEIESSYHDLEELLNAVKSREPECYEDDNVPVYAQVARPGKQLDDENNIYNKLDPNRMTVNSGDPDRWGTYNPSETGPSSMGAPPNRVIPQPPTSSAPPVPGTTGHNFSPDPEEGLYEMQTLKL